LTLGLTCPQYGATKLGSKNDFGRSFPIRPLACDFGFADIPNVIEKRSQPCHAERSTSETLSAPSRLTGNFNLPRLGASAVPVDPVAVLPLRALTETHREFRIALAVF